jgi:TatD DNase family protein
MQVIDTHAHLDQISDIDGVLTNARESGVVAIVAVSEDIESSQKNWHISQNYTNPRIHVAMGMHPSEVDLNALASSEKMIHEHKDSIKAIGEIGLDYWYKWVRKDQEKKQAQRDAYRFFLQIAKDLDLPAVIHSRGAWSDCFEIARSMKIKKAIFHWYSGPQDVLEQVLDEGYYISATPSLQYSPEAQKAVRQAPIDRLLIETDTPVYYRNRQTNEGFQAQPRDVLKTLDLVCGIKKIDPLKAAQQCNQNASQIFNI